MRSRGKRSSPRPAKVVPAKRAKANQKTSMRTIICLPCGFSNLRNSEELQIKIPRGKLRQTLRDFGLIGKICINHNWTEKEIKKEVSGLFKTCFDDQQHNFSFVFLNTFPGTKALKIPRVNSSFVWDARAVLSLNKTTLYILCNYQLENCKDADDDVAWRDHDLVDSAKVKIYNL